MTDDRDQSGPNVNPSGKVGHEVNIKRLGTQQKRILRFLYENDERRFQQAELIREIYGEVTDSRKASVSRSVNRLMEHGVVDERKAVYVPELEAVISHRVNYQLTDAGTEFVEKDDRFPTSGKNLAEVEGEREGDT